MLGKSTLSRSNGVETFVYGVYDAGTPLLLVLLQLNGIKLKVKRYYRNEGFIVTGILYLKHF